MHMCAAAALATVVCVACGRSAPPAPASPSPTGAATPTAPAPAPTHAPPSPASAAPAALPAGTSGAAAGPLLCISEGTASPSGDAFFLDSPSFRATLDHTTAPAATVRFRYDGATATAVRLGSGALRRQIGIKLRAKDACNVVYAVWRFEPSLGIVVQVKRNEGQSTSAECGNRGYHGVRPTRVAPAPAVSPGSEHVLRAVIRDEVLTVWTDGIVAWQGALGEDARALEGPVGLRTDNGRFLVSFWAGDPAARVRDVRSCP